MARWRNAAWPLTNRPSGRMVFGIVRAVAGGIAIASVAGLPTIAAAFQESGPISPASGGAEVVAQGVTQLPAGNLVWRVVAEPASPAAQASPVDGRPGFLVGDSGTLLVEGVQSGDRSRLAPGEASFVRGDEQELRAALDATATTYFALEIVPAADTSAVGSGALVFASEPFAGPNAPHDLDLVRDTLDVGATTTIPAGTEPTVVLVTAGSATVSTDKGVSATLAAGEAGTFSGGLTLTGGDQGSAFVAGFVGPETQTIKALAAQPVPAATTAPATPAAVAPATPAAVATTVADDADGDGLSAAQEAELNTDPNVADTDGDGLTDGEEVNTYGTQPLAADTDGDGIDDGTEVAQGTNPLDPNDPAPAAAPAAPQQQPAATDTGSGAVDTDGDGLPDAEEIQIGTDPNNIDTDADDLSDGDEVNIYATGPLNPDTDGDGYLDGLEVVRGTDPNDPNSHP